MTKEEAIEKVATGWWKDATPREIVEFQLFEDRLCMPFAEFHQMVGKVLGRSVWTHEFARPDDLRAEFRMERPPRNQDDVIALAEEMVGKERVIQIRLPENLDNSPDCC